MSIKSDNWIKKMSTENDMISPFQPNQVKINEDSNEKLISYGLSSYGYDVRCANEFKVFMAKLPLAPSSSYPVPSTEPSIL